MVSHVCEAGWSFLMGVVNPQLRASAQVILPLPLVSHFSR